jgi:hypothetical protein
VQQVQHLPIAADLGASGGGGGEGRSTGTI